MSAADGWVVVSQVRIGWRSVGALVVVCVMLLMRMNDKEKAERVSQSQQQQIVDPIR